MGFPIIGDILNYVFSKEADDENRRLIDEQLQNVDSIALPGFSKEGFNPEFYSSPEELFLKQISEDPRVRQQLIEGLNEFKNRASGLSTAQDDYGRMRAVRDAEQIAKGREGAIYSNAAARGLAGSGLEFALRQQSAQDAASRALEAGMAGAAQSQQERQRAQMAYTQGLSGLRGQDLSVAGQNAAIANQGSIYNNQNRNRVAAGNVDLKNQGSQYNIQRGDANAIRSYQAAMDKQRLRGDVLGTKMRNVESTAANKRGFASGLGDSVINVGTAIAGGVTGSPALLASGLGGMSGGSNPYLTQALMGGGGGGAGSQTVSPQAMDPNAFKLKSQYGWY